MKNFQIGDRVQAINYIDERNLKGKTGTIVYIKEDGNRIGIEFDEQIYAGHNCNGHGKQGHCRYGNKNEIVLINNNNNNNMSIKENFVLFITKEPQKSFRKAEITNGDDLLTQEGTQVFLSWLLHSKYAEEFKKEVVDIILKEKKEEEKK